MRIPDATRSLVIEQWELGAHRDTIAADNGLSAGTVTNIVNEWRAALGHARADEIREFGIILRRVGITPAQSALGFRTAMIMNKLGVKEDDFESFIFDVYNRCKDDGLSPQKVVDLLNDLVEFAKANAVPFSQISGHVRQKAEDKNRLVGEIEDLTARVKGLEDETKASENRRAFALFEEKMTSAQIESYSGLMEELKGFGVPIDDLSKFAKMIHGISQKGYDVRKVISEFSDLESTREEHLSYQVAIPDLKKKYEELKGECYSLEQTISSHNQTLSVFRELEEMEFDLKVLKLLRNTVNEIASANEIPPEQATQKFCKDIEEQYDDKLGFELKLMKTRSEIDSVAQSLIIARAALLSQPVIGVSLQRLFAKGLQEHDIVEIANLFERSNDDVDKQALLGGLQKYRILNIVIEKLNQELERLKHKAIALGLEKQRMDQQDQRMTSLLTHSKETVNLLRSHDLSNYSEAKDENMKILAMFSLILQNLYVGDGGGEKLLGEDLEIDLPVGESTSKGLPELKSAVAKGLTIMMDKLGAKREQQAN
jgi:hypothetical protein